MMQVAQLVWSSKDGWTQVGSVKLDTPSLVLYFGSRQVLESGERYEDLHKRFPNAVIMGATSGGEILNAELHDDTVVATLIQFKSTVIRPFSTQINDAKESKRVGEDLAQALKGEDLVAVFVLSDGTQVNGSTLVEGIREVLGNEITITGGLASDGDMFQTTLVGIDFAPKSGCVAAIGLYGENVQVGHGSFGGWDSFGPKRVVTKSKGNVLYELDGKPALALYKSYLGEEADKLPGSALLFPLSIKPDSNSTDHVVRTILSVDENDQSMTFAGDVPEGYIAQLMHGNFDRLVDGACESARLATETGDDAQQVAILISCIGRRLLMKQHIGDELEIVYDFWNGKVPLTGFYSYGEISPHTHSGISDLHNQTMTITTFGEKN